MNIRQLAQALRAAGFKVRIKYSDEPETTDDEVQIVDTQVAVSVGMGTWMVARGEGEGDDFAMRFWTDREQGDLEGVCADLRAALQL